MIGESVSSESSQNSRNGVLITRVIKLFSQSSPWSSSLYYFKGEQTDSDTEYQHYFPVPLYKFWVHPQ